MKVDGTDPAICGFEQIYRAAFKAARYSEIHRGLFPRANDAEDLGWDTVLVTWCVLQSSEDLVEAVNGSRDPLTRDETRCWVDRTLRLLDQADGKIRIDAPVICGEWATMLIDKAFLPGNRETPLFRALGSFVRGATSRIIYQYRKIPKVEDGTTYDGKRRRRLLKADEPLGDNADAVAAKDSGSIVDAVIDARLMFAQLTELQRAVCLAYFVDEETLDELSSRPWPGHGPQSLYQIRKVKDGIVNIIEEMLGSSYSHNKINKG